MARTSSTPRCRRKHSRPTRCTSTRAAISDRRSWSAFAPAGTSTGCWWACASTPPSRQPPEPSCHIADGAEAGEITSGRILTGAGEGGRARLRAGPIWGARHGTQSRRGERGHRARGWISRSRSSTDRGMLRFPPAPLPSRTPGFTSPWKSDPPVTPRSNSRASPRYCSTSAGL